MGYRVDISDDKSFPTMWTVVVSYVLIGVFGTAALVGLAMWAYAGGPHLLNALFWTTLAIAGVSAALSLWRA